MIFFYGQAEPPEQRPFVQLLAKKKALEVPSKILLSGAEHLRNLQSEVKGPGPARSQEDFHIELLRLRQNWRLRKVGNSILGDLSYRTAGSQYKQSGVFEVSKAEVEVKPWLTPDSRRLYCMQRVAATLWPKRVAIMAER